MNFTHSISQLIGYEIVINHHIRKELTMHSLFMVIT